MGYERQHAIIVTTFDKKRIDKARYEAIELGMSVTEVIMSPVNERYTFLIGPDGSKEGWSESDEGDRQRGAFVRWLQEQASDPEEYEPDSWDYDWCEVQYGDENHINVMLRSDATRRI